MKTNVMMKRELSGMAVVQRSDDGFFDATSLLKQFNRKTGAQKQIKSFFENKATQEYVEAIEQDIFKRENSANKLVYAYVKERGRYGGTWMHAYLFIDFCMWLNPGFKLQVIKFVADGLIEHRHEAGDGYKKMCRALADAGAGRVDIMRVAQWVNYIVYSEHRRGIRQESTAEELKRLKQMQDRITFLLETGIFRTATEVLKLLRIVYHRGLTVSP